MYIHLPKNAFFLSDPSPTLMTPEEGPPWPMSGLAFSLIDESESEAIFSKVYRAYIYPYSPMPLTPYFLYFQ